jgi:hypothetical protein
MVSMTKLKLRNAPINERLQTVKSQSQEQQDLQTELRTNSEKFKETGRTLKSYHVCIIQPTLLWM